jgi:hypothetical protein
MLAVSSFTLYSAVATVLINELAAPVPTALTPVIVRTTAIALIVFVAATVIGPEYIGELVVGVVPFVV